MSRPSLKTPCVADRYADKARERIAEFDGGLIALRRQDDGTLLVSLYQLDQNVKVTVAASHLIQTQPAAAATTMLAALKRAAFVMESPAFPQSLINGGGALDDVRAAIAAAEGRAP